MVHVLDNIASLFSMVLSLSVPVLVLMSAVLKDFQDSCDVKADGGKRIHYLLATCIVLVK